jgi:hypothetical protein
MKRVYELDVYKLAEELSDMVWQDFDKELGRNNFLNYASQLQGHGDGLD